MGTIDLENGDVVYLDANAVIYAVEDIEPYAKLLHPVWTAARSGRVRLIGSELLIVETLAGAVKSGNHELIEAYEGVFIATDLELKPITAAILRKAADLRFRYSLKVPDAIHVATAMEHGNSIFLTNDIRLRNITEISPIILSDALMS